MKSRRYFLLPLMPLVLSAQLSPMRDVVPLKQWQTPLYWQPGRSETPAQSAQADVSALHPEAQTPVNSLVFVGMTPCRLVDTRGSSGFPASFGAPSLIGQTSRTFPIQSSPQCAIPGIAQAYSFNVTVVPPGFLGFITLYPTGQPLPATSTLDDSPGLIIANAAIVPAGNNGSIDVFANNSTDVIIDINGFFAPQSGITLAQGSAGAPTLSFAGDAGTGIFSSAAGTLNVTTAGSTRLTVDNNGNMTLNSGGVIAQHQSQFSTGAFVDPHPNVAAGIKVSGTGGDALAARGQSVFSVGAFVDPHPNVSAAIKVSGTGGDALAASGNVLVVSGKVGIGTTSPGYLLDASGLAAMGGLLASLDPAGSPNYVPLENSGKLLIGWNQSASLGETDLVANQGTGSAGGFSFFTLSNAGVLANLVTFTGAGPVGIGTAIPHDQLEVNGQLRVAQCVKNSGGTQIAGTCPSDERLKTNIEPFTPVLEKLVQLQPVHFNWRADEFPDFHFGTDRSYGLLAQEVERVLPELVSQDKQGFKAVNYSELPLMLLQAIRDLSAENHNAREENRKLETRLAALEAQVSAKQ